jgi:stage III sporulation protein AD
MTTPLLSACMLALLGVCAALVIKQWKADFVPLVRVAIGVGMGILIFSALSPLITYLQGLIAQSDVQAAQGELLLKALGIALLTQACADICRESGEGGAASAVELTGKVEILLLCLPLLEEILLAARELLNLGG